MKIIKINEILYIRTSEFYKVPVKYGWHQKEGHKDIPVHPTAADDFYGYVYDNLKRDKSISAEVDFDNQISEGFDIPDRYVAIRAVKVGEFEDNLYAFFVEDVLVREDDYLVCKTTAELDEEYKRLTEISKQKFPKAGQEVNHAPSEWIDKAKDFCKAHEQWEADIITEDSFWWPNVDSDVFRGKIYEDFLKIQEMRNELVNLISPPKLQDKTN